MQQLAGGTVHWNQLPVYLSAELLAGALAALAYVAISRTRADNAPAAVPEPAAAPSAAPSAGARLRAALGHPDHDQDRGHDHAGGDADGGGAVPFRRTTTYSPRMFTPCSGLNEYCEW